MKVTKTNVHRLRVERDCGCAAQREYSDARYANPLGEGSFTPCTQHQAKADLAELLKMILLEDVSREAENHKLVVVSAPRMEPKPSETPVGEGESETRTPITRPRPAAVVARETVTSGAQQRGPRRDPTEVRTLVREHNVGKRAAIAGKTPVVGVKGANTTHKIQVGDVELSTPKFDIDLDSAVEEDPAVAALTEGVLLPDLEDDPSSV